VTDIVTVPGWAWPVIWVGLSLALLVMLGAFAWILFRKATRMMDALGELAERGSLLEVAESEHVRPAIAVLAAARDIQAREEARRLRRAQRRQYRHDRRLARAHSITLLTREARSAVLKNARTRLLRRPNE